MKTRSKFLVKRRKRWKDAIGLIARIDEVSFSDVLLSIRKRTDCMRVRFFALIRQIIH